MNEHEARAILGVDLDSSYAEIKQAYRFLVKALHPDGQAQDPDSQARANQAMARVNEAWKLLLQSLMI